MSTDIQTRKAPGAAPRRAARPTLRLVIVLSVLSLVGAGLIGFHAFKANILKGVAAGIVAKLPTVSTLIAATQTWQPELEANGSLRASQGTDLSAEISGMVGELHFVSGDEVAAGVLLLRLRPNDDDAKLAQLRATAELDAITYQRDARQLRGQGVAQSTVDTDAGTLKSAQAQVAAQQAVNAEKFVRAPFAGRLGLRQVDLGQYLSAGTKIVTLQALDPMFLDFYLPQQALSELRVGQRARVHVDAYPGLDFPAQIAAINPQADSASRMVQIRALLANPGQKLLPGMFATVAVAAGEAQPHIVLPLTAISANPYGSLVYVVRPAGREGAGKPKLQAGQVFVTTGLTQGDQVQVLTGIKAGDLVVTSGQLKLYDRAGIVVDNTVQPTNDRNPVPADQ